MKVLSEEVVIVDLGEVRVSPGKEICVEKVAEQRFRCKYVVFDNVYKGVSFFFLHNGKIESSVVIVETGDSVGIRIFNDSLADVMIRCRIKGTTCLGASTG